MSFLTEGGFSSARVRFGNGKPTEPIHRVHPDASPVEARFTVADKRFNEVEQRLTLSAGGSKFVSRVRSL